MGDLTKNFSKAEFACRCGCGALVVDTQLVCGLQALRDAIGKPIHVNSGRRCKRHNTRVGGAKSSYHLKGLAADISVRDMTPVQVRREAEKIQVFKTGGIGTYPGFLHVDTRKGAARWGGK